MATRSTSLAKYIPRPMGPSPAPRAPRRPPARAPVVRYNESPPQVQVVEVPSLTESRLRAALARTRGRISRAKPALENAGITALTAAAASATGVLLVQSGVMEPRTAALVMTGAGLAGAVWGGRAEKPAQTLIGLGVANLVAGAILAAQQEKTQDNAKSTTSSALDTARARAAAPPATTAASTPGTPAGA
jgi:hypothetical protein